MLRVYYDHRQNRLNRVQGDLDVQGSDSDVRNDIQHQSPRKRKISSEGRSAKRMHANFTAGLLKFAFFVCSIIYCKPDC